MELAYAFVICLLASILQCVTGFGFAIISMPLLLLFFPIKTVAAVVAFASLCLNLQVAYKMRKHISPKIVVAPIVASYVGRTIGMNILMTVNESALKVCLGVLMILITCYLIFLKEKVQIKPNIISGSSFGLASGILGGMFNTGGPPMVMYYLCAIKDNLSYLGSTQFTFAIGGIYTVLLHLRYGNFLDASLLVYISFIAVTLGTYVGCKLFYRIKNIDTPIYIFMILMGIYLIGENLF